MWVFWFFIYLYIFIHYYINRLIGLVGRVFTIDPGDWGGFNSRSSHTKVFFKKRYLIPPGSIPGWVIPKIFFFKWYLIPHCLTFSIIRYVTRVKWGNPGKGVASSPIEKGAFRSYSTTITNFYILIAVHWALDLNILILYILYGQFLLSLLKDLFCMILYIYIYIYISWWKRC